MKLEAVFVDRDGTIGGNGYFVHPKDFELYPFSQEAISLLKKSGMKVFAFTNQHRIATCEVSIQEFLDQFEKFGFDDAYICPHGENDSCRCRKPKSGLLIRAAQEYNLDLSKCAVIGDVGDADMIAADNVGCVKILVETGWGMNSIGKYRHLWKNVSPDYVAVNLLDATKWLLSRYT